MKLENSTTAAFCGYRTEKIIAAFPRDQQIFDKISNSISSLLDTMYGLGYTTFLSGLTAGFDTMAAQAVVNLRTSHPEVRLIAVTPFDGYDHQLSNEQQNLYKRLCDQADEQIIVAVNYYNDIYLGRSDFMLDSCSLMVTFHTFMNGGALYTTLNAKRRGVPVLNLANHI